MQPLSTWGVLYLSQFVFVFHIQIRQYQATGHFIFIWTSVSIFSVYLIMGSFLFYSDSSSSHNEYVKLWLYIYYIYLFQAWMPCCMFNATSNYCIICCYKHIHTHTHTQTDKNEWKLECDDISCWQDQN